jgi:ABC-type thiamine transport system substrate-binding protein
MKTQDIKSYFANHASKSEFCFTADGAAFFTENDAFGHAQKLADKKITTISRAEADAMEDDVEVDMTTPVVEEIISDFTVALKSMTGEAVKEKFANNDVAELHFTADGQAFEDIELAKSNGEEIEMDKITTITKEEAAAFADDEVVALEDVPASYVKDAVCEKEKVAVPVVKKEVVKKRSGRSEKSGGEKISLRPKNLTPNP